MHKLAFLTLIGLGLSLSACASGTTPAKKRATIDTKADLALSRLAVEEPGFDGQLQDAAGYAYFSDLSVDLFLVGGGGGYGVAVDNASGERTYMRVAKGSLGLGLGIKDFEVVFVFRDEELLEDFVENGWDLGGEADVAAVVDGDSGGEFSKAITVKPGVVVYQLTLNGLAARVNLSGAKFFRYEGLN